MAKGRIEQEIFIKIINGKDVGELQKAIKQLEKTKAELTVTADTADARKELDKIDKQLAELRGEKAEIEVTAKVDRAISALDEVATEAKQAEAAAEALSVALGPELAGKANLDEIIGDFNRMGLSMVEITANADRLGAKLRDVGQKDVGGRLTTGFSRMDGAMKSAGSSSSVLANSVGNAAQDLGQIGGLAGTAGVAIGQMGEYIADAALSGERIGSIAANFAKVAGPIAGIAVVLGVVQGVMEANKQRAEEAAAATERYGEAMADSADDAVGLAGVLRENTAQMQEFSGAATETGDILKDVASNIPLLGSLFADTPVDVVEVLNSMGVGFYEVGKAIGGNVDSWNEIQTQLQDFHDLGLITDNQLQQTTRFINEQRDAVKNAEEAQAFQNLALGEAVALYDELLAKQDPLSQFPEQWDAIFDAIRDGTLDTERATAAINLIHNELGLSPSQVLKLAIGELAKTTKEVDDNLEDNIETWRRWRKEAQDAALDVANAQLAVDEMAGVFNDMARREGAIEAAFALGNAPIEALEAVVDVNEAIRDLGVFIRDEGLPDIFDPNDIDVQPFLAKISSLRGPLQQQISSAFATGGSAAATATADAYVKQIVASMRGKLTEAQVRTLLGLDDLEATLQIAVDQSSLALAKESLELLVGLKGESPWTASIALALASGEITPQAAQALINEKLAGAGVEIPAALGPVANTSTVQRDTQRELNRNPLTIPVKLVRGAGGLVYFDQGGVANGVGGIAGEKGPEILDGRYLTTGPTYVPPGTRVTSRRRTEVILRRHPPSNLRRYDQGGVVPVGPINVNISAGVIGDRYATMRAVDRGVRDGLRLRGSRA